MALDLLQAPLLDEKSEKSLERAASSYENLSECFCVSKRAYTRQYSHIYVVRLMAMRPIVEEVVRKTWEGVRILKLSQVKVDVRCCVVGTLFKRMQLRPSILKEVSQKQGQATLPAPERYISGGDSLILEDEMQRIPLSGNLPVDTAVTGTVIALLGIQLTCGTFEVDNYTYCGLSGQPSPTLDSSLQEDRYVLLVSGLGIGSPSFDALATQMFVDTVTGQLGGLADQEMCSKMVRVIIAGNSLSPETNTNKERRSKIITRKIDPLCVEAVKELDDILTQLASSIPVDLMPGPNDPTNFTLPQQPLHRCMFPQSVKYPTLTGVPNPYQCNIGGRRFIGTSGQSIDDIHRFTSYDDRMEILKHTLMARHLAPTAPDTLGCYPFVDDDPFFIKECPAVYFAGNQPAYESRMITGANGESTLLVLVPDFCVTHQSVLINLKTLDCQLLTFNTDLSGGFQKSNIVEPMDESQ